MTVLRLDQVRVRVARTSGSGSDPAPDGLHVWLDTPGGPFDFQHYVVTGGHLAPAGAGSGGIVRLDTRWAYWSLWDPTVLGVGTSFEPVSGFGYPLPARFSRSALILPNTRSLTVYYFNLTSVPTASASRIAARHAAARTFYQNLHIDVSFTEVPVPTGTTLPLYLVEGLHRYDVSCAADQGFTPVNPDFSSRLWQPPGRLTHALICYWVEDFQGMAAAEGNSWPMCQVSGSQISLGEMFTGPPCAYFFMRFTPLPRLSITEPVAHEIAHCLLYEPGLGTTIIATNGLEGPVRSHLARLHIEGPPPPGSPPPIPGSRLYAELFTGLHTREGDVNLMARSGGTLLLPWQVAVIRASQQIGDGP